MCYQRSLRIWFSLNHMLCQCVRGLREPSFEAPLRAAVMVQSCEWQAVPVTNWMVTLLPVCCSERTVFAFRTVSDLQASHARGGATARDNDELLSDNRVSDRTSSVCVYLWYFIVTCVDV